MCYKIKDLNIAIVSFQFYGELSVNIKLVIAGAGAGAVLKIGPKGRVC